MSREFLICFFVKKSVSHNVVKSFAFSLQLNYGTDCCIKIYIHILFKKQNFGGFGVQTTLVFTNLEIGNLTFV